MLNEMARKIAEAKAEESDDPKDPKLCAMCQKEAHKYRCPKCNMRTCCVTCSKEHKDKYNCDGVRGPFQPVQKLSQFTTSKSIEDQHFLEKISGNIHSSPSSAKKQKMENIQPESLEDASKSPSARLIEGVRYAPNSGRERYLMEAAVARHIFFAFDSESKALNKSEQSTLQKQPKEKEADNEEEGTCKNIDMGSHINFYSQNIFWKLEIVFRRPNSEENSYNDYSKLVHNIPDSIHVATILRQFLKPRPYGCIVSASDLDLQILQPFIEKGIDNLNIFMPVPKDSKHRYYAIDGEKTLLENVRKRFIVEHPTFVIVSAEETTEINGRLIEDKKASIEVAEEGEDSNREAEETGTIAGEDLEEGVSMDLLAAEEMAISIESVNGTTDEGVQHILFFSLPSLHFSLATCRYRGTRRWEGKRHKGEDLMARKYGHHTAGTIRKDVLTDKYANLSKREQKRMLAATQDDMSIGVDYSLNKHNRWMLANRPVELLRMAKKGFETSVVEGQSRTTGNCWPHIQPHSITAVHTRIDRDSADEEEFDVRTARSAGKGQINNIANFTPTARELSQKKPRTRKQENEGDVEIDPEAEAEKAAPQVHYSVQTPIKNKHMYTKGVWFNYNYRIPRNTARPRKLPENDLYDAEYENECSEDERENEEIENLPKPSTSLNLSDCIIDKSKKKREPRDRLRTLSSSLADEWENVSDLNDGDKPNDEALDLSKVHQEDFFHETIHIPMNKWKHSGIETPEAAETIAELKGRKVAGWTVFNLTDKVKLHATELLPVNVLVVALKEQKKMRKRDVDQLVMTINTTIPIPPPLYLPSFISKLSFKENLQAVLLGITEEIQGWREMYRFAIEQCTDLPVSFLTHAEDTRFLKEFHLWLTYNRELFSQKVESYSPYRRLTEYTALSHDDAHSVYTNSKLLSTEAHCYHLLEFESSLREFGRENEIVEGFGDGSEMPLQRCSNCYEFEKANLIGLGDRVLCMNCVRKNATGQIRSGNIPIHYQFPLEESTFDLLSFVLPLPVFNFYSKRLLMMSLEPFITEGRFDECYACSSLILVPNVSENQEFNSIYCNGGHSHFSFWCRKCGGECHWPMECGDYSEWQKKWEAQFELEAAREQKNCKDVPRHTELLHIKCSCKKGKFHAYATDRSAKCPQCGITVDVANMQVIRGQFVSWVHPAPRNNAVKRQKIFNPNWFNIQMPFGGFVLSRTQVENVIKRPIAELCFAARSRRFNRKETNIFGQKCGEQRRKGLTAAEGLEETRKMALQIVENGTGWTYIHKKETEMLKHMKVLMDKWVAVENCIKEGK
ncbi:hypothetical protein WR25_06628 isoform B [Diploscapter pachys]|nr:hypothetical protein WR25_06628 isoform B [Diploscapter pachys]